MLTCTSKQRILILLVQLQNPDRNEPHQFGVEETGSKNTKQIKIQTYDGVAVRRSASGNTVVVGGDRVFGSAGRAQQSGPDTSINTGTILVNILECWRIRIVFSGVTGTVACMLLVLK